MAKVEGGSYRPLYLKKETSLIKVKPFQLDKYPVTNAEFAEFCEHTSAMAKKEKSIPNMLKKLT